MINGEIVPILEAIEFSSKDELLTKLRDMQKRPSGSLPPTAA